MHLSGRTISLYKVLEKGIPRQPPILGDVIGEGGLKTQDKRDQAGLWSQVFVLILLSGMLIWGWWDIFFFFC